MGVKDFFEWVTAKMTSSVVYQMFWDRLSCTGTAGFLLLWSFLGLIGVSALWMVVVLVAYRWMFETEVNLRYPPSYEMSLVSAFTLLGTLLLTILKAFSR